MDLKQYGVKLAIIAETAYYSSMENNFEQMLNEAYALHVSGKLKEASAAYEKLLEIDSANLDVKNLYAQLCFAACDYDKALELFKEIYEKLPIDDIKISIIKAYLKKNDFEKALNEIESLHVSAEALRLKAAAYRGLKNIEKEKAAYNEIKNRGEASAADLYNLSILHFNLKDYENALRCAIDAYEKDNKDLDIILHISAVYQALKNEEKQLEYLAKAAEISPSGDLLFNIGVLCRRLKDDETALEYFKAAVQLAPDNKYAYLNIARIFSKHDKNVSADIYRQLAEKYPEDKELLTQLYVEYTDMMNFDDAYYTALKLINAAPGDYSAYLYAADAAKCSGKYEEAVNLYEKAAALTRRKKNIYANLAEVYSILNQPDKAEAVFEKYPSLKKTSGSAYNNIMLRCRKFEPVRYSLHKALVKYRKNSAVNKRGEGLFYKLGFDKKYNITLTDFKKYKSSSSAKVKAKNKYYAEYDLWGHNPDDKTIFIYSRNGMGDVIMFSRYIPILGRHTSKIILCAPKSIYRLLKYNFPQYEVIEQTDDIVDSSHYDYTSSYFTLLTVLEENTLYNIPYSSGYLSVEDSLIKEKQQFDVLKTDKRKIGLFWMGSAVGMVHREVKLKELTPLLDVPNTQFYSFQLSDLDYESDELKKKLPVIDLAPYIKDYSDTAAFLKNMDILITIDTSIANLSGALGVKTFMMLAYEADWRWFYDTEKTPWYGSIRIFKQKSFGEWGEVIERIKHELEI